jgi:hypothetical protein
LIFSSSVTSRSASVVTVRTLCSSAESATVASVPPWTTPLALIACGVGAKRTSATPGESTPSSMPSAACTGERA